MRYSRQVHRGGKSVVFAYSVREDWERKLRAEDLANAWAYVRSHRDEIERQIAENEAD